jgi:hypothetical protein
MYGKRFLVKQLDAQLNLPNAGMCFFLFFSYVVEQTKRNVSDFLGPGESNH